jgi:hypothetical protein
VRGPLLFLASLLLSCEPRAVPPALPWPIAAPQPASPPPPVTPDPLAQVDLATSTSATPWSRSSPLLVVSTEAVTLDGDTFRLALPADWSKGFDAQHKRSGPNDLYVTPVAAALARVRGDATRLALAVDRRVTYRLLIELVYTAGQSGYATFVLLVRSADGELVTIESTPPGVGGRNAPLPRMDEALNLVVLVVGEGMSVKASGGNIQPGCGGIGAGLTLPITPAGHDFAGLRACVGALKAADPRFAAERVFTVATNPDVPWQVVASVADALRVDAAGQPLLPDIRFGVAR